LYALICVLLAVVASGCAGFQSARPSEMQSPTTRSFFERTIIYSVDSGARSYMIRLERLVDQISPKEIRDDEGRIPDRFLITLYRDADANRDYRVTEDEARQYYQSAVMQLEDRFPDVWRAVD